MAALPHRLADALRDPAMGLAVHDQRIDATSDVVNARVARELDVSGLGIDLDFADRATIRKYRVVHLVVGRGVDAAREPRQGALRRFARELEEIERAVG